MDTIKRLRNHLKINDWVSIQTDFLTLNKQLASAKNVVAKEGVPKFWFKIMVQLEESAKEATTRMKEDKGKKSGKALNAPNGKALNAMSQVVTASCHR